jgi:LysR family nitrogen assimilation transcriptional regulator
VLNLAQPALGAQIRQLEKELDVELIVRHSRGVSPTPAGKLLYRHAQRILDGVEQARYEVSALKANKQLQLRLGVSPSMVLVMGPDLLMDAAREMPDITISLEEERSPVLLDALESGQLDLAFLYNVEDRPELERRALLEEDFLLFTAPSEAPAEDTVGFAEALRHDLVIGGKRSGVRNIVEAEAQRLSLEVRLAYEVHSVSSMKTMVARGAASTIMPYSLLANELRTGVLAGRRIVRPQLTRTLYIVRRRAHSPLLDDERVKAHMEKVIETYIKAMAPGGRPLS